MAINLPEQLRPGVYSDVILVWHNQWGFTLDFLSQAQPDAVEVEGHGEVIPADVVARVRIPPSVIFPLIKALNTNLTTYEDEYGTISATRTRGRCRMSFAERTYSGGLTAGTPRLVLVPPPPTQAEVDKYRHDARVELERERREARERLVTWDLGGFEPSDFAKLRDPRHTS